MLRDDYSLLGKLPETRKKKSNLPFLIFYALPLILYLGLIFFMSSQPSLPIVSGAGFNTSYLHIIEYFVLSFLLLRLLKKLEFNNSFVTMLLIIILIGSIDEIYQGFFGRVTSLLDLLFDFLGGLLGWFFIRFL